MNGEIRDNNVIKGKIYSDNNIVAKLDYVPTTVVNYEGDYTVTPSTSEQTLETKNKLMVDNLVVESMPSIWKLIGSAEFEVASTQTSASTVGDILVDSSYITKDKIIYVRVRDKAGKRNGYFLGSDNFFINYQKANGSTTELTIGGRIITKYADNSYSQVSVANTNGYGVYAGAIYNNGRINISKRYNASNSSTINGIYKVEIYTLEYPDNKSVFDI